MSRYLVCLLPPVVHFPFELTVYLLPQQTKVSYVILTASASSRIERNRRGQKSFKSRQQSLPMNPGIGCFTVTRHKRLSILYGNQVFRRTSTCCVQNQALDQYISFLASVSFYTKAQNEHSCINVQACIYCITER